eukprot:1068086-Rhodomonas_salina.4
MGGRAIPCSRRNRRCSCTPRRIAPPCTHTQRHPPGENDTLCLNLGRQRTRVGVLLPKQPAFAQRSPALLAAAGSRASSPGQQPPATARAP